MVMRCGFAFADAALTPRLPFLAGAPVFYRVSSVRVAFDIVFQLRVVGPVLAGVSRRSHRPRAQTSTVPVGRSTAHLSEVAISKDGAPRSTPRYIHRSHLGADFYLNVKVTPAEG